MSKDSCDKLRPQPQDSDSVKTGRRTGRGHNERDCDQLVSDLRAAIRARDDFISVAAHELRNPITPIQLSVRLIRIAAESGDQAKLLAEAARLERLLDRFLRRTEVLLDVTQLVSGKPHLELAEVNVSDVATAAIDGLRPFLALSGSALAAAIEPGIIGLIDATALHQIIDNLLSNAIKYGAGRPIEIVLDTLDANARLRIRDQGMGISAEDQARIFEPFERAVKRTHQPGFGLGLWVTRRLTEAMGGSIAVNSEKGTGSLFTVNIPLKLRKTDG
ncbi:MAG: HAMP domain-containing sensor histidine kinase [Candidatus Binataceae bacterium]|jgi:signal transduction histidine kinase